MERLGRLARRTTSHLASHLKTVESNTHTGYRYKMRSTFNNGRLYLHRDDEERAPLLQRLSRIEGQVRGLQQMIVQERYCGDELQQGRAILAAMREVIQLLVTQHVGEGLERAADGTVDKTEALQDIEKILRPLLQDK